MNTKQTHNDYFRLSIIEDNRFVREGWNAVLSSVDDISIRGIYGSCEEAFASEDFPDSDMVLMDIGLPGISGIEGVKKIKEKHPEMIVIMCTVYDDDTNIFDAICAGAVGYLLKKTTPEELIAALRVGRNGGSPMTPNIARKVIASFQTPNKKSNTKFNTLNDREKEILQLMAVGKSYIAIAEELFLSIDGVRYHIRNIYEKLQVHSRGEAIAHALRTNQIAPPK